ncbi:hypothetical protein GCM10028805_38290 [Spirosoma harenae]
MEFRRCLLTGYQLGEPASIEEMYITYSHVAVGKVKIGIGIAISFQNKDE